MRFTQGTSMNKAFPPKKKKGPKFGSYFFNYDAKQPDSITLATGVSNWESLGDDNSALVQATAGEQPSYVNDEEVRFDGSNDRMLMEGHAGFSVNDLTIFIVLDLANGSQGGEIMLSMASTGGRPFLNGIMLDINAESGGERIGQFSYGGTIHEFVITSQALTVVAFRYDSVSELLDAFDNNGIYDGAHTQGVQGAGTFNFIALGGEYDQGNWFGTPEDIQVMELGVVLSSLTDDEINTEISRLLSKHS